MEIINYPFDGRSFSDRIWKQKDFLLDKLTQSFTQMLVQGTHPKTLSKEFAKQFKSREYDAYRLLHTEYSYLAENASQKAYEEDEVPAYKYLATLDSRTCGVCGKLDGRIVKMGDGKFGVNMPPLHPLCRCTTVPYYEELDENVTRIARNKDGENIEVPHDMSYEEWKKKYISKKAFAKETDNGIIISGGISGARNPYGEAAEEHAKKYYGLVRSMKTDVQKVAKASGYSEEEIQKVKNYIFIDEHDLGEAGYKRFDPDYMMGESWRRLIEGKPEPHDLTLLHHEIMERKLIEKGYSQDKAHKETSLKYNYDKESTEFYGKIKKFKKE